MINIKTSLGAALAGLTLLFSLHTGAYAQETAAGDQTQTTPKVTWSRGTPPDDDSYTARNITRRQVHSVDPNIWTYTAEFAERFKMPKEWIAPDLQGAEAVAFRIESFYKSCGWGGDPKSCHETETRCVMDVYFSKKQQLPWDVKLREADFHPISTSAFFIGSRDTPLVRPRDGYALRGPFSEPTTGKPMYWRVDNLGATSGELTVLAYDRQIFAGTSFVTLSMFCGDPVRITLQPIPTDNSKQPVYQTTVFPQMWRNRVKELVQMNDAKNEAYFKKIFEEVKKKTNKPN